MGALTAIARGTLTQMVGRFIMLLMATAVCGQGMYDGGLGPSTEGYQVTGAAAAPYGGPSASAQGSADICAPGFYRQCQCSCMDGAQPGMPAPGFSQPETQSSAPMSIAMSPETD